MWRAPPRAASVILALGVLAGGCGGQASVTVRAYGDESVDATTEPPAGIERRLVELWFRLETSRDGSAFDYARVLTAMTPNQLRLRVPVVEGPEAERRAAANTAAETALRALLEEASLSLCERRLSEPRLGSGGDEDDSQEPDPWSRRDQLQDVVVEVLEGRGQVVDATRARCSLARLEAAERWRDASIQLALLEVARDWTAPRQDDEQQRRLAASLNIDRALTELLRQGGNTGDVASAWSALEDNLSMSDPVPEYRRLVDNARARALDGSCCSSRQALFEYYNETIGLIWRGAFLALVDASAMETGPRAEQAMVVYRGLLRGDQLVHRDVETSFPDIDPSRQRGLRELAPALAAVRTACDPRSGPRTNRERELSCAAPPNQRRARAMQNAELPAEWIEAEREAACLSGAGSREACVELLRDGADRDPPRAVWRRACELHEWWACPGWAERVDASDPAERGLAMSALEEACERSARVCAALAERCASGQGVERDEARATRLYMRACRERRACAEAARRYAEGIGVEADLLLAAELNALGCGYGQPAACRELARAHAEGRGLLRSPQLAFPMFERACVAGDDPSCLEGAAMLLEGTGTPRSATRARDFYRVSCEREAANGCIELANLLENGRGGDRDREGATAMRARACEARIEGACP